jgi:hypothetical protein
MKRFFKMAMAAGMMMALPAGNRIKIASPAARALVIGGKPDISKMRVKELRAMARAMKIKGRSKAKRKSDLIKMIKGAM